MSEIIKSDDYGQFKAVADNLGDNQFIGEGAESKVWRTCIAGEDYVIKIAKENVVNVRGKVKDRALMTQSRIESGQKALGILGLEQFVAGSIEDKVVVFRFVDGIRLTNFRERDVDSVTNQQRQNLKQTILNATDAGLVFDSRNQSGANAFYSIQDGFTLIDYEQAWRPVTYRENWAYAMRSLGPVALQAFAR